MQVTIGGQSLTNLQVQSATTLTGSLAAGLCPGTYPAIITTATGTKASGGTLIVTGVQKVSAGAAVPALTFPVTGKDHEVSVPLTGLLLTDTTCATGDGSIAITNVTAYVETAQGRKPLTIRAIQLDWPGAARPATAKLNTGSTGSATAVTSTTVHIPRTGTPGAIALTPTVTLLIPAQSAGGRYVISADVTLVP